MAKETPAPGESGEIDALVKRAKRALEAYRALKQEETDRIAHAMTLAGLGAHTTLARLAVEETGRGVYEDKIIKNLFATEYIWHDIKNVRTAGVIDEDEDTGIIQIAEPVGVVAGVTPVTNPTSTVLFKSIIAAKARCPIIFGFHPSAQGCSAEAARIVREAARGAGAPEDCIQWIENPSPEATRALMNHPDVALVLATGGSSMVRAAYSTGKPALGVGPGNVPCYVHKSAALGEAANDLLLSKTFDNGMICASEQAVVVDQEIAEAFEAILLENGVFFLSREEKEALSAYLFPAERNFALNPEAVGRPAAWIAGRAGLTVPEDVKVLAVRIHEVGAGEPFSGEKLSPVLACLRAGSEEEAFSLCRAVLHNGGLGHTAAIHAREEAIIRAYGEAMEAGRIIVNAPSSQGGIGDIYNDNTPSLTLGCGTFGKNSTTENVSALNLVNIKRVARRRVNMQWFKIPPKIYFEYNAVRYLEKMPQISRAFIVTDGTMVRLGNVDKVLSCLRRRPDYCHAEIFSEVEPDPSVETVMRGAGEMEKFSPDVIIAVGGGSVMDAAKGMWIFYEHPEASFEGMRQKFFDIRKRAYYFPSLGQRAKLVCIPTTSGTGSEVTSFAVITDKKKGIKYPLADYELTPDVAIVDPQFTLSVPKRVTADTGMDVLTHAIEAYVSVLASDYTDGLALHAIRLVFAYLPRAFADGADRLAREKLHNASCIAGMAFTNAFLGLNHSMAHKLGSAFLVPHGRANAVLLPWVIRYNGERPRKLATFPKYGEFVADRRYQEIARFLGLSARTPAEGVESLALAVEKLREQLEIPGSIRDCGVEEKAFLARLDALADEAHADQCTPANPRYPLVEEIKDLYRRAYYGGTV